MARGINKVTLIGHVGGDPEVRYMQNGNAVATFSLATTESWKDKQTGEKQDRTEWHRIACFNRLGEIVGEYVKKGSRLYIEGSLRTRKWQDQQGQDRYTTEIVAADLQMLDSKNTNNYGSSPDLSQQPRAEYSTHSTKPSTNIDSQHASPQNAFDDLDDDVPF